MPQKTDVKGHTPNALDKWLLVRAKKYPNKESVPATVSSIMMRGVHDRARVQGMLWMIAGWSVALFISGLIYRRKAKTGETWDAQLHERQMAYNKRKEAELKLEAALKGNK